MSASTSRTSATPSPSSPDATTDVHDVTDGDSVTLDFEARPEVVVKAEGRAVQLHE